MFSSQGRSIVAAASVIALAFFAFVHADTTAPTTAQILLQSLTPPTPFIPYINPTAAATSPVGGPQRSAPVAVPIGVSLSTSLSLNANLIPENAIIPVAALATSTASVTSTPPFIASTTNATLIASLYAEVKVLEAQLVALEAAASSPSSPTTTTTTTSAL